MVDFTFFSGKTGTGTSTAWQVKGGGNFTIKKVTVDIRRVGGASTVQFEGCVDGTNYVVIPAARWNTSSQDYDYADSTTGTGERWEIDTSGLEYVRLNATVNTGTITAVGNGSV